MNAQQQEKISRFLKDKTTSDTIKGVLEAECLKASKDRDVQNLAARFLALEIVGAAWKELEKWANKDSEVTKESRQVGL